MTAQLSRSSRRFLKLSFATPRPIRCPGCICLTPGERRALRRVGKIVRQLKRQVRHEVRRQAAHQARAQVSRG